MLTLRVPAVMSCCGMTAVMGRREGRSAVELERRGEEEEEQEEMGGSRGVVLWDLGTTGSVDRFST